MIIKKIILHTFTFGILFCAFTNSVKAKQHIIEVDNLIPTKTLKISYIKKPQYCIAVGSVNATEHCFLSARIPAHIVKINITDGQVVKKNQVLAELDNRIYLARLNQAKKIVDATKAMLVQANQTKKRIEKLYNSEVATQKSLEQSQANQLRLKADYERALFGLDEAKTYLSYTKIISPYDGVIKKCFVEVGENINPAQKLFAIYNPSQMQAEVKVGESLISNIKIGDVLTATIAKQTYNVTVNEISPIVNQFSRSFLIKALLPKNIKSILPGVYCSVNILCGKNNTILVPLNCVKSTGQLSTVLVKNNQGIWQRKSVRVGQKTNKQIEILSGLKEGDIIGVDNYANK